MITHITHISYTTIYYFLTSYDDEIYFNYKEVKIMCN